MSSYPIYHGTLDLGSKDSRGRTIEKGSVRVKCPEEFVKHKIPVTYTDVKDQVKRMKKAKKYEGDKKLGEVYKVEGNRYAYCNAIVKISVGDKKKLPNRLKKWQDAVRQARSEGFTGLLRKGSKLYDRSKEIYNGDIGDNLKLVAETDIDNPERARMRSAIERNALDYLKEEERQKEEIVRDENEERTSLPYVEGKSVTETITEDAIAAKLEEDKKKREIMKEYLKQLEEAEEEEEEEEEAQEEEGELEDELKQQQKVSKEMVKEILGFECDKNDLECWQSILEDIWTLKNSLDNLKAKEIIQIRERAQGNIEELLKSVEDTYERNLNTLVEREDEIFDILDRLEGARMRSAKENHYGSEGGGSYPFLSIEEYQGTPSGLSRSTYRRAHSLPNIRLLPSVAEHKLMNEMFERAKYHQ